MGGWGSRVLNLCSANTIQCLYGIFDHSKPICFLHEIPPTPDVSLFGFQNHKGGWMGGPLFSDEVLKRTLWVCMVSTTYLLPLYCTGCDIPKCNHCLVIPKLLKNTPISQTGKTFSTIGHMTVCVTLILFVQTKGRVFLAARFLRLYISLTLLKNLWRSARNRRDLLLISDALIKSLTLWWNLWRSD